MGFRGDGWVGVGEVGDVLLAWEKKYAVGKGCRTGFGKRLLL